MEAEAIPFPNEDTTPPVTKMNLLTVIGLSHGLSEIKKEFQTEPIEEVPQWAAWRPAAS